MNEIKYKRNQAERRYETLNIIYQMKQNNLTSHYPAIRELLSILNTYVIEGKRIEIDIPFPELKKRIVGVMEVNKKHKCVVVLKSTI